MTQEVRDASLFSLSLSLFLTDAETITLFHSLSLFRCLLIHQTKAKMYWDTDTLSVALFHISLPLSLFTCI